MESQKFEIMKLFDFSTIKSVVHSWLTQIDKNYKSKNYNRAADWPGLSFFRFCRVCNFAAGKLIWTMTHMQSMNIEYVTMMGKLSFSTGRKTVYHAHAHNSTKFSFKLTSFIDDKNRIPNELLTAGFWVIRTHAKKYFEMLSAKKESDSNGNVDWSELLLRYSNFMAILTDVSTDAYVIFYINTAYTHMRRTTSNIK